VPRGVYQVIHLLISFCEIENLIHLKEPAGKTRMFCTLLNGQALYYFEHHLRKRFEAEDSEITDKNLIKVFILSLKLMFIPILLKKKIPALNNDHIMQQLRKGYHDH
jgi:hypothetical protein